MKNRYLNLFFCLLFMMNNIWSDPNVKVVKGILVTPGDQKETVVKEVVVIDQRPIVRGILVRAPDPYYRETVYIESDPVEDALIGTTIFLGLTALFCGAFSPHWGHGYHHRGYHHGYRHGGHYGHHRR